jgi:hypothetical protein
LFETEIRFCGLVERHPRVARTFIQNSRCGSRNWGQKDVIPRGTIVRVSPNLLAIGRVESYLKFLHHLTYRRFDWRFIRLDHSTSEVPRIVIWDRSTVAIISQLHEDCAIWPSKNHPSRK